VLSFFGCNAVKYVPENELMLTKNTVYVNNVKSVDTEITDYIVQRPNQLVLGIPLPLHFYNVGNKNFETDFEQWKLENPKRYNFTAKVFSDKQVRGLRNFKYDMHKWWLNNGEPPVLIDTKKISQTIQNLTQHYYNQGYFKAIVNAEQQPLKNKKVAVNYYVETEKPYKIDTISTAIESKILDSIYQITRQDSYIKTGKQFKLSYFIEEQNRITKLFRNSGIFRFSKNAITFEADSTKVPFQSNVLLTINDSIGEFPFKIQKIKHVNIYTDWTYNTKDEPIKDSVNYNGYLFLAREKLNYKPKHLLHAIFISPSDVYKDENRELTRRQLRSLNNFRSVDIKYTELEDDFLEASVFLTPMKKFSIGINTELTHSNIKQLGVSGKLSFLNRNIFKGSEILKFSIQGSFIDSKDAAKNDRLLNAWEIGGDISLELPRFLLPFSSEKLIAKEKDPRTIVTFGTSLQKNIGLDKRNFTGIMDYTWKSSNTKSHSLQVINAQFIKNLNIDSYFNIYKSEFNQISNIAQTFFNETLTQTNVIQFIENNIDSNFEQSNPVEFKISQNIKNRYNIITENVFVPSSAYTFTYNNSENYKDASFSFFRARLVSSGNVTTLFSKKEENKSKMLFNMPIAQYVRTDFEYKKFWDLSYENVLGFRSFLGVAIPYGNSTTIPFSRSYFIGGPNDLRAWQIYDLGPGSTNTGLEYNIGNLKFLSSLEYRFKVLNSIKGALFIDAGNIWDISGASVVEDNAKFKGLSSLKDIAIGSGFGVRYDLSFILLRLDLGFKTYEPYLKSGNRWFTNYNFSNTVFNFGISYPF
jgi:outer membrane protein assembly factor BamA